MCVLSSMAVAGGLTAVGLTSMASSAAAVAATTVAANAALGAGISAGIGAATGARGRQLGTAAGIGALSGGALSGLGMAAGGVTTLEAGTATPGFNSFGTYSTGGGLFGDAATTVVSPAGSAAAPASGGALAPASSGGGAEAGASLSNADKAQLAQSAGNALASTVQGGIQAYGSVEQAKEARKGLEDQAKFDEVRAQQALDRAALEKYDAARRNRQLVGKAKVAAASNGVMLETRAESLVNMWEQDQNAELAYDASKIDYNAQLEAWGYRENARRLREQGRLGVRSARRSALTGTLASAGVGLGNVALSGFTVGLKNGWFSGGGAASGAPASGGFDRGFAIGERAGVYSNPSALGLDERQRWFSRAAAAQYR